MIRNGIFRKIWLLALDIVSLYLSLFIALTIRYGSFPASELLNAHKLPFFFVYLVWIIIFYIAGLYDIEKFISQSELRNRILKTMAVAGIIAVLMFYSIPFFQITPKTNLLINTLIAFFIIWFCRKTLFNTAIKSSKIKVFFIGKEQDIADFAEFINNRPQFGYKTTNDILYSDIIVVSEQAKQNPEFLKSLYEMIRSGKTIIDFDRFYESITGKIPVSLISEVWFLENFMELNKQDFEKIKRVSDIIFSLALFIPFIIIYPAIAAVIKLSSKGSVFYKQKRIGKNGKIFSIIKFRSMIAEAEKNGAQWAKEKDDRITFIGNILRKTRIDELPQIWNVLKGDLSFVGPRPERPEFVEQLSEKIPHYSMRHLIKPGLSGWAQINFPYGASVEDATEKLQYDLYYIKNRSFLLETSILLKTAAVILSRKGI